VTHLVDPEEAVRHTALWCEVEEVANGSEGQFKLEFIQGCGWFAEVRVDLNRQEAVILAAMGDTCFEATERALDAYGRWESGRGRHGAAA